MRRGHTPFGYEIKNGIAVIDEEQVGQLRRIYDGYLGGLSLVNAAKEVGLKTSHAAVKRMLQNRHYLGDDFYPAIIDQKTFDSFEEERQRREKALGRDDIKKKTVEAIPAPTAFRMATPEQTFTDPYRQAEYLYSQIAEEE